MNSATEPQLRYRTQTLSDRRRLYLLARVVISRHHSQKLTLPLVARALASSPRRLTVARQPSTEGVAAPGAASYPCECAWSRARASGTRRSRPSRALSSSTASPGAARSWVSETYRPATARVDVCPLQPRRCTPPLGYGGSPAQPQRPLWKVNP
jgi:hypothetical protein